MLNNSYKKVAISKSTDTGNTSVTIARNNDTIKLNGIAVSGNTIQDINLLDKSTFPATQTINGITFTNNGDGTITVDGTAIAQALLPLYNKIISLSGKCLLLGCPEGGAKTTYSFEIICFDNADNRVYITDLGNGIISTQNLTRTYYGYIAIRAGTTVSNLVFRPQLYDLTAIYGEGNEPTTVEQFLNDYPEPYQIPSPTNPVSIKNSNDNGITFTLQGKNLIKYPYYDKAETVNGVTFIYNDDGSVTLKGTATANAYRRINRNLQLDGGSYTLSGGTVGVIVNCFKDNAWFGQSTSAGDFSFTIADGGEILDTVSVYINSGTTVDTTIYPQIEKGNNATLYEPYFSKTVSIPSSVTLSDGTSLAITLTKGGDKADILNVDKNQGIVTYQQNVGYIVPTDVSVINPYTDSGKNGVYFQDILEQSLNQANGYCSYETIDSIKMIIGNNDKSVYWIGVLDDLGITLDEFKTWFTEIQASDTTFRIEYELETPIEYDLSNTSLGQSLLSLLSDSYAQTVIAKSDSTIPTSEISVDSTHQYESYKTIRYVHETPTSENSSNLQISNNKAIMTINSLELAGGETATTDDIVITRSGKNLLDGNLRVTPKTLNGITIQYLPDEDCYLFNGTCIANSSHYLITHNMFVNGRITASMVVISGTCEGTAQFSISYRDDLSETTFPLWVTKNIITGNLSINQGAHKYIGATWFYVAKGTSFNNYKIKIQMELGTVVTEYEPYLSSKSLTFSRDYLLSLKGANNLLDKSKFPATQTINGVTFTNNGDGTITVDGTATGALQFTLYFDNTNYAKSNHKYLIIGSPENGGLSTYRITASIRKDGVYKDGFSDSGAGNISRSLADGEIIALYISVANETVCENLVFKPQLYDLTAIYGEGNEPTTVEQFLKDYPLSSTDKLSITRQSVKYNDTDITSEVTGLSDFMESNTETAIIDTNYTMGSISADVKKLFVSYKKSIYQADE